MKDTNNLSDFNVWGGTDYLQNTKGFISNSNIQPTNEWSYNGENSLKMTGITNEYVDINRFTDFTTGVNITISLIIYAPTTPCRCNIRSNKTTIVSVNVPVSNEPQKITISDIIPSDINWITLRTFLSGNGEIYIDDVKVTY